MSDDLEALAWAEAEDKWPRDGLWMSAALRQGFVAGFLAHAAQQPTRDDIARALDCEDPDLCEEAGVELVIGRRDR